MDPYIHEQMTQIVAAGKKLKEELLQIQRDIPMWDNRVIAAKERGMHELSEQAAQHVMQMRLKAQEIEIELESLREQKRSLHREHKLQPGQAIVEKTQAMVESVRQGGLIDLEEAQFEREFAELKSSSEDS